jgi:hypothetical protein
MATGGPTRATLDKGGVVTAPDQELPGGRLLLIMALQTERLIPGLQHLLIHRPVWIVTGRAVIPQRFMLEDIRPALRFVTLETGFVRGGEAGTTTDHGITLVRIMAIRTGHFAHGMCMRQGELALLIRVTLETRARIRRWVDNVIFAAARLGVDAARTVAGFAADVLPRFSGSDELRMSGIVKRTIDGVVALGTGL